jgi:hypothetical protein
MTDAEVERTTNALSLFGRVAHYPPPIPAQGDVNPRCCDIFFFGAEVYGVWGPCPKCAHLSWSYRQHEFPTLDEVVNFEIARLVINA